MSKYNSRVIYNGREYASADDMPAEARSAYDRAMQQVSKILADTDGDGVPDGLAGRAPGDVITFTQTDITFNGQTYSSIHEMPPDIRRIYEQMLRNLTPSQSRAGDNYTDQGPGDIT